MGVYLRKKKLAGGRVSLYLDIYQDGRRYYEFLKIRYSSRDSKDKREKMRLAESVRAKRELELNNCEHGFVPHFKRKSNFVEYCEKKAVDKCRILTVKHLKDFTGGHVPFSSITEEWLEEFKAFLLSKLKPNAAGAYFAKVKACLNQAVKDRIITQNPGQNVKQIPKVDTQKAFLTIEEIGIIAQAPCHWPVIKFAFIFACYTGLRLSDVRGLEWGNIRGHQLEITQDKTKEALYLPLCDMAMSLLKKVKGDNVFPLPSVKVFNLPGAECIRRTLKKLAKRAGIEKDISFHTARHTFATMSLTLGVDLYTVSKLLGHTDIKNTQIYAKIVDQKKMEAVQRFPMVEVMN
jgi:integrase